MLGKDNEADELEREYPSDKVDMTVGANDNTDPTPEESSPLSSSTNTPDTNTSTLNANASDIEGQFDHLPCLDLHPKFGFNELTAYASDTLSNWARWVLGDHAQRRSQSLGEPWDVPAQQPKAEGAEVGGPTNG
ncbi:hypothetical protein MMC13_007358 [Lambiella insularis]|nr:hypothetical protein [Lambiella insularis]